LKDLDVTVNFLKWGRSESLGEFMRRFNNDTPKIVDLIASVVASTLIAAIPDEEFKKTLVLEE
jgi:hypothetical protein